MSEKYFIISIFVLILITESIAETPRGAREYNEELPTDRTELHLAPKLSNTTNDTSPIFTTFDVKPHERINQTITVAQWEPLACSQCLNDRYLVHYVERGCQPVKGEHICRKPCPKYFQCPKRVNNTALKGCQYNGKVYKYREEVPVKNPCKRACYCDQNVNARNISEPTIRCAHVDCPMNFRAPDPNCYYVYEEGKCCGVEKCSTSSTEKKCLYGGQRYKLGQRIFPKEDPCVECVCEKSWNQTKPLHNKSCKKIDCDLQSNDKFKAGCLPIYHEQTCCPIEYYCPPPEEHQCKFNGKKYLIGEKIDIGLERTECKCIIPPDFTCIKKVVNVTNLHQNVTLDKNIKKFQTLPTIDITNSSKNPFKDIPNLESVQKCPPFVIGGLKCAGIDCQTIIDTNGCQACKCEAPCPLLKCRKGCRLEATTPGVCPKCNCN